MIQHVEILSIIDEKNWLNSSQISLFLSLINPLNIKEISYNSSLDLINASYFVDFIGECKNLKCLQIKSSPAYREQQKQILYERSTTSCIQEQLALAIVRLGGQLKRLEINSVRNFNHFFHILDPNIFREMTDEIVGFDRDKMAQELEFMDFKLLGRIVLGSQGRQERIDQKIQNKIDLNSQNARLNLLITNCLVNFDLLGLYYRFTSKNLEQLRLQAIYMEDTGFDKVFSKLQGIEIPQLKEIEIIKTRITLKNICSTLYKASSRNLLHNLTELKLSNTPISDSGAITITLLLTKTQNIQKLRLNGCKLTLKSFEEIIKAVNTLQHIQLLDLSSNDYSKKCDMMHTEMKYKGLKSMKLKLDLTNCNFTQRSLQCVSYLILHNQKISKIILSHNTQIQVQGINDLVGCLKHNLYLQELDISNCCSSVDLPVIQDKRVRFEI
eukprot:403361652